MKLCALIIDDQPDSVKVIKTFLEGQGIRCQVANDLQSAELLLKKVMPHLLVVDISLSPTENGLEWLQSIRTGPFGKVPAIVMTSSSSHEDTAKSLRIGVDDYIVKPADLLLLKKKVAAMKKRLTEQPFYRFATEFAPLAGKISFDARIHALSEVGVCLSTPVANSQPVTFDEFESSLFRSIGVTVPQKLTFLNFEKETDPSTGWPLRNFCQVKGWSNKDVEKVLRWMKEQNLRRSF